jgi:dTDP-4-dehydrorhamnose reductase
MRIALTGTTGQVGRALVASVAPDVELIALQRDTLDLTDAASIEHALRRHKPAVVINAAAYTSVDKAEEERELAFVVNSTAVGTLARACRQLGARMIHLSTDYVFDGRKACPYVPEDAANPLNVYGASKLAGEKEIATVNGLDWLVVRTAWVYAPWGRNFLATMLRLFRERDVVTVVNDQVGTPTSALSLARCIWHAVADRGPSAILHYTDDGEASWYDFAVAIHQEACVLGLAQRDLRVVPITSQQYSAAAHRPARSVLDTSETRSRLNIRPQHWRTELRQVLQEVAR